MENVSKPTTSFSNTAQPSRGIAWQDYNNTWDTELRTWDETGEIMDNISKPTTSFTNIAKP